MSYHAVVSPPNHLSAKAWIFTAGVTLCGCDRAPVHIHASLAAGVPLAGLEITALPFDPQGLLDSLTLSAPTPKPAFGDLAGRLLAYHRHEISGSVRSPSIQWIAVRDSVARRARDLRKEDRRDAGYKGEYARFRELYARYTAQEILREKQLRGSLTDDRALADEATRASDSLRAWEREAYRELSRIADQRMARMGRPLTQVQTDSLGSARVILPNGDWWVEARLPQLDNPFAEYDWTVPIRVTAGLPIGLPLVAANASVKWRY